MAKKIRKGNLKKIRKGNLKPQKVAESRTSTGYQGTRPAATAIEVF